VTRSEQVVAFRARTTTCAGVPCTTWPGTAAKPTADGEAPAAPADAASAAATSQRRRAVLTMHDERGPRAYFFRSPIRMICCPAQDVDGRLPAARQSYPLKTAAVARPFATRIVTETLQSVAPSRTCGKAVTLRMPLTVAWFSSVSASSDSNSQ
jgi:hypothetical protein